jgi:hypothetical protein
LRVFSPELDSTSTKNVWYATREHGDTTLRPRLDVEQAPDVVATRFGGTSSGQLQVTYNVLNSAVNTLHIDVYRSLDGVTPVSGPALMTYQVVDPLQLAPGIARTATFDPNFVQQVLGSADRLVAKIRTTGSVGELSTQNNHVLFSGGAFKER